ncbi:MAG: hypothetical protein JOZ69_19665, partial [Myxococcales bacterium]|nr:hypothetical protein [Myxococcales bacterium]
MHLPSGRVLGLEPRSVLSPRRRRPGAALFSELFDLVASGDLKLVDRDRPVDPGALALCDFHALRGIATRVGWLAESPVEFLCRNCDAQISQAPCSALELGPFVDGELD